MSRWSSTRGSPVPARRYDSAWPATRTVSAAHIVSVVLTLVTPRMDPELRACYLSFAPVGGCRARLPSQPRGGKRIRRCGDPGRRAQIRIAERARRSEPQPLLECANPIPRHLELRAVGVLETDHEPPAEVRVHV